MVLMGLLILSLVLQVTSSILLVVEKMSEPMNYTKRKNINISITVMMILIIFISILTTAFLDNPTLVMTPSLPPPTPTQTQTL